MKRHEIATVADIEEVEKIPLEERLTVHNTYDMIKQGASLDPDAPAMSLLLDEVPLTPVGKIFKPALRWDAIRRVYKKELEAVGNMAESVEIEVTEDKVRGLLATIRIKLQLH